MNFVLPDSRNPVNKYTGIFAVILCAKPFCYCLFVKLRADNAKSSYNVRASFSYVRLTGNVIKMYPASVLVLNYALCTEHHSVFVRLGKLTKDRLDLVHAEFLRGLNTPACKYLVGVVVMMVVVMTAASAVFVMVVIIMMVMLMAVTILTVVVMMLVALTVLIVMMVMLVALTVLIVMMVMLVAVAVLIVMMVMLVAVSVLIVMMVMLVAVAVLIVMMVMLVSLMLKSLDMTFKR